MSTKKLFLGADRHSLQAICGFALICALLGAFPHILFGYHLDVDTFYQGAWDEGFYLLTLFGDIPSWNDYPIKRAFAALISLFEPSARTLAMVSDFLLPAIVVLSAGLLALSVLRSPAAVLALAFFFVFGSDILEFNSSVAFLPGVSLNAWLRDMSLFQRQFFVDAFATFLSVFRTPEPQLSISALYLHLAVLIAFVSRPLLRPKLLVPLLVTAALSSIIYSFFSLAALAFTCAALIALLISGDRKNLVLLAAAAFVGLVGTAIVISTEYTNEAGSMLFESRLPMMSPAAIYGLIGCAWVLLHFRFEVFRNPLLLFSVALLLFPLSALNQQVVSGVMVQTLNWERYVNIPVVILGIVSAVRLTQPAGMALTILKNPFILGIVNAGRGSPRIVLGVQLALIFYFVGQAQWRTYQQFLSYNVMTYAYASAADQASQGSDGEQHVVIDNMHFDSAIRVRSSTIGNRLPGYTWVVSSALEDEGVDASPAELALQGFDAAARLGLSADGYREKLRMEMDGAYCWPHLMYLAPFLECAPYVSDFRLYDPSKLSAVVEKSVTDYAAFLADPSRSADVPGIIVTSAPLESENGNAIWESELLSVTEVETGLHWLMAPTSAKVYTYRQSARGRSSNP
ncbi:hypothetical protein QMT40_000898 [Parvibaculaceae bacterium PLY_AMNH_Bact1]|nr:hypothetical protein QMT40_000898 [Parvibaculaceae bacterium PLY_AMNH_Bact1]